MASESYPVSLARASLDYYYQQRKIMPLSKDVPKSFLIKAGVFVSLKKQGKLRGCIGTFLPTQENARP